MKILIIGNSFLPLPAVEGGAIETLVDEYLKHSINNNNYIITVYSPYSNKLDFEKNKEYKNCEFRYIEKNKIKFKIYKYLLAIKRRLFKSKIYPTAYCQMVINDLKRKKELSKYDLVIVENEIKSLPTYKKYINSKIVEHLHNDYLNIDTPNAKKIVDSCDEIWCVSNFIANRIEEISNSKKTRVLYNGIDTNKYSEKTSKEEQDSLKTRLNIKCSDYIVLYIGRIMQEKGVLELIKSFNIAKQQNNNLKLLIVGDKKNNKKSINEYYKIIQKESLKNKDSIIFFGKSSGRELINTYNIADLQVIPTMCNEAFGLIAVEGICSNNPLIVTNSGGLLEIVNKNSAIIVNRNNIINELSEAIIKLSTDKKLSDILVNNANKIKEKFDYKQYNKTFDKLINSIIGKRREK